MTELGSVRQVLRWFREENLLLPAFARELGGRKMIWKLPEYASLLSMLTNPTYAGAYVYGKTETRTKMVEGRARKSAGHRKPQSGWKVLIQDHHPAYLSWEEYERNQSLIAANAHIHSGKAVVISCALRQPIVWAFRKTKAEISAAFSSRSSTGPSRKRCARNLRAKGT